MSVNLVGGSSSQGGRSRGLRSRAGGSMADINVTNLVDVILVILIIFMVSAPLLQSGINVDLPKSNSAVVTPDEDGVVVTIERKNGKDGIYVAGVWSVLDNFETHLSAELKKAASQSVYLQADSLVQYGTVIDVITRLKKAGVNNLGLMTEPLVEK